MGYKAKHPCRVQGCPALVPAGTAYCEKHRGEYTDRGQDYDKHRGTSAHRGYDGKWQAVRRQYLKAYPNCARCGYPAEMVDHIQPIAEGGSRYAWDNLQPMCWRCHRRKTEEDRKRREMVDA